MPPCPQSKTGHCWTDAAHDARCLKCCHCGEARDLPPKVVEILVNVHATRKVPGAVQYSSDERGGSVSLRAAIREGENLTGTMRLLWDAAEVELERRGLTVVRRDAEVGPGPYAMTCVFLFPGGARCGNVAGTNGRCARPDHQKEDDTGRERLPSASAATPPDDRRGGSPSKDATSSAAPKSPEDAPSRTPQDALAKQIRSSIQRALDARTFPKDLYADLIGIVKHEFGPDARIGDFHRLGTGDLIRWVERTGWKEAMA